MRRLSLLLLLASPALAFAQQTTDRVGSSIEPRGDSWTFGVGAAVRDSPYAGEGTRIRPFPLVAWQGERFFWQGLTGGMHVVKGERFTFDVLLAGRFDGVDIKDLGRRELAANGIDAALLSDRHDAADAGVAATWRGAAGSLRLRALADITGTSEGYELSADYGYPIQAGRTRLVPGVGVRLLSEDMADYYYGTLDREVARGVRAYRPGAVLIPQASLDVMRPLFGAWTAFGALEYQFLPDEIADSPLIQADTDGAARLMIGISRRF